MPAGFTHIYLTRIFMENSQVSADIKEGLGSTLDLAQDYFQLGAIGPDLPYSQIPILTNNDEEIADKFHYELTNQVPIRALIDVKQMEESEKRDYAFAFFCGYISHIVADGIIHPFVRDKVGSYKDNSDAHRMLEMRLDVLLLDYLTSHTGGALNINTAKIQDHLASASNDFEFVAKIFSSKINEIYGEKTTVATVTSWAKMMENIFELAANSSNQYYAWIPMVSKMLYKDSSEIIANKDKDLILKKEEAKGVARNFRGQDTHFFNDCLPEYFKALSPILEVAYRYIYLDGPPIDEKNLPAINLDTGRPLKFAYDLDKKPVYWN